MHDSTSCCALLRYNGSLSSWIYESLDWGLVYCDVYVKHTNLSKKFWELLLSGGVVLRNQSFSNFFFNLLLSVRVVWISVHKFSHPFLLLPLGVHLNLQLLSHDFLKSPLVVSLKCCSQLGVVSFQESSLMRIIEPNLLELIYLFFNSLILLVVKQTTEHLIETLLWSCNILLQGCEKSTE